MFVLFNLIPDRGALSSSSGFGIECSCSVGVYASRRELHNNICNLFGLSFMSYGRIWCVFVCVIGVLVSFGLHSIGLRRKLMKSSVIGECRESCFLCKALKAHLGRLILCCISCVCVFNLVYGGIC